VIAFGVGEVCFTFEITAVASPHAPVSTVAFASVDEVAVPMGVTVTDPPVRHATLTRSTPAPPSDPVEREVVRDLA